MPTRAPTPTLGAVIVNYEAGAVAARRASSRCSRTTRPAGRPRSSWSTTAPTDGSVAELRAAFPDVPVIDPGANLGYGRAANLGIAATRAPIVAVLNPDAEVEPGTAAAVRRPVRGRRPARARSGRSCATRTARAYPSARSAPSLGDAVGHALLGTVAPDNRFTRSYRQLDADPDAAARRRVDLGRRGLAPARRRSTGSAAGTSGSSSSSRTWTCAAGSGADGWRIALRARRPRHARRRRRAGPAARCGRSSSTTGPPTSTPPSGGTGPRRLLLPVAAVFLAARGVVVAGGRGGPGAARNARDHRVTWIRVMAKASKYNRARIRSRVRRPKRRGGSMMWTVIDRR